MSPHVTTNVRSPRSLASEFLPARCAVARCPHTAAAVGALCPSCALLSMEFDDLEVQVGLAAEEEPVPCPMLCPLSALPCTTRSRDRACCSPQDDFFTGGDVGKPFSFAGQPDRLQAGVTPLGKPPKPFTEAEKREFSRLLGEVFAPPPDAAVTWVDQSGNPPSPPVALAASGSGPRAAGRMEAAADTGGLGWRFWLGLLGVLTLARMVGSW